MHDEVIKRLREEAKFPFNDNRDLFTKAADAIEELQKDLERSKDFEAFWQHEAEEALKKFQVAISNKPKWIPVTERLPEEDERVLVVAHRINDNSPVVSIDSVEVDEGKLRFSLYMGVDYWMPLPEPPKDGES